ncbi:ankyrin, partial [Schizophyllum commune H4-8]|uniref:ankyrin n=1 Tax=Schizophyllum commune (strain H4-8 / FGSC 9210) TaxID=578458 RepID=UPI00215E0AE7
DIGESDGWSLTSLHLAAAEGHLGTARLLLERGAHVSARAKAESTPLTTAASRGREDVVRLLLDKGAQVEECEEMGWT